MKTILHKLILALTLLMFNLGYSQEKSNHDFTCFNGDLITIKDLKIIPAIIDTLFIKKNLCGKFFVIKSENNGKIKFRYTINEIVKINDLEYRMVVLRKEKSDNTEYGINYLGFDNYKIILKNTENRLELLKVEYLYTEF